MTMQSRMWTSAAAAMVAALVLAACGSSEDPIKTPQYAFPDELAYCTARAERECSAAVIEGCQVAKADCQSRRRGVCGQDVPSGSKYRPAQADACLAAVAAAHADTKLEATESATMDKACALLFQRGGIAGTACDGDVDCDLDTGLRCVKKTGQAKGACHIPTTVAIGLDCSGDTSVCDEGTFCTTSTPQVCAGKFAQGKSCSDVLLCADTLQCVPDAAPAPEGKCENKLVVGDVCQADAECASNLCAQVGSQKKCSSMIQFSPNEPLCDDYR